MSSIHAIQYHPNSAELFDKLASLAFSCWLDSGRPNSERGRYDIMTALPQTRLVTRVENGKTETIISTPETELTDKTSECPFILLSRALKTLSDDASTLPFIGGALGYWGYELGSHLLSVNIPKSNTTALPDMAVGIYHWAIVQDHKTQEAYLAYLDSCEPAVITQVNDALGKTPPTVAPFVASNIKARETEQDYTKNIERVKDYIAAGDCYQVNYAQQFTGEFTGDPYSVYKHLREVMASPNSAYMDLGAGQRVLSLSPERFIEVKAGEVLTQPIKGTAPRNKNPKIDKNNADALLASEKNRAENLMIVDLLRNDLGKHCEPGSIKVPELFSLKSYPNVHHLVSHVVGKLKADSTSLDLLRDSLPGGSITGAPKKTRDGNYCRTRTKAPWHLLWQYWLYQPPR